MNILRLTESQHQQLKRHLFSGDGKESISIALCGRLSTKERSVLCVNEIVDIDDSACSERSPVRVTWDPSLGYKLYDKAASKNMAVLKIHCHPGGLNSFSAIDDHSDAELFESLHSWTDGKEPHASAVMLPSGEMFGRFIDHNGDFTVIDRIVVAGDEILIFDSNKSSLFSEVQTRTAQVFGEKTINVLSRLKIGVVGCSGTGSWVIEQLARLSIGHLLLVDPDIVEEKNLNRIVNSTSKQAQEQTPKVLGIADVLQSHGTKTTVTPICKSLFDNSTARSLASCDVLFGCMDSIEGRDTLNRIAAFYSIPYFDLGVRIDADGMGGVKNISAVVNYLIPDGSSLLSRGLYTGESLRVDSLRRTNPSQYDQEVKEGYIKGAKVSSPAVISVNGLCATSAINELLARVHPFRASDMSEERVQQFDLVNNFWMSLKDGAPCSDLSRYTGRGDMKPFLNQVTYD